MEVIWAPAARKTLRKAVTYCKEQFGRYAADRFIERINRANGLLEANPYLGKYEPSLQGRSQPYRSLVVHKYYKVVYYIQSDTLYVADLWDTRREPAALVRHIK